MAYHVIYDGNCNLCVTFTELLEKFDQGKLFDYIPMQDEITLAQFGITAQDCHQGMILIDGEDTERRWQGSEAAEEITRLLPLGDSFIRAYRHFSPVKDFGDRLYSQIRDHRYQWFGRRRETYYPAYPFGCSAKNADNSQTSPS